MHKKIALFALVLILFMVNGSIYEKEQQLKNGRVVFLKLAPVDPRSLMQGDYMALRFDVAGKIYNTLPKVKKYNAWRHNANAKDGRVVVQVERGGLASFVRLYGEGEPLRVSEMLLHYRVRNGAVKFATNAFFFEEGSAKKYEKAKYGAFRVNEKGELLLVAMADKNLIEIH